MTMTACFNGILLFFVFFYSVKHVYSISGPKCLVCTGLTNSNNNNKYLIRSRGGYRISERGGGPGNC